MNQIARGATQCLPSGQISRNGSEDAPVSTGVRRELCREVPGHVPGHGGCKFPAAKQRNLLELLFQVKGLHLKPFRAEVCEFSLLLVNYLRGAPTNYNQQLYLYRRVLGLDTTFRRRAVKHVLQKGRKFDPAWGPGCNQKLQDL